MNDVSYNINTLTDHISTTGTLTFGLYPQKTLSPHAHAPRPIGGSLSSAAAFVAGTAAALATADGKTDVAVPVAVVVAAAMVDATVVCRKSRREFVDGVGAESASHW